MSHLLFQAFTNILNGIIYIVDIRAFGKADTSPLFLPGAPCTSLQNGELGNFTLLPIPQAPRIQVLHTNFTSVISKLFYSIPSDTNKKKLVPSVSENLKDIWYFFNKNFHTMHKLVPSTMTNCNMQDLTQLYPNWYIWSSTLFMKQVQLEVEVPHFLPQMFPLIALQ